MRKKTNLAKMGLAGAAFSVVAGLIFGFAPQFGRLICAQVCDIFGDMFGRTVYFLAYYSPWIFGTAFVWIL